METILDDISDEILEQLNTIVPPEEDTEPKDEPIPKQELSLESELEPSHALNP
jgi:hypothetical protein